MRVAVIGGAGYIGSHVVLALQAAGHEAVVFDNLSTGTQANVDATGARFYRGDVRERKDLLKFFFNYDIDAVIHLAARKAAGESMQDPAKYAETNIQGSINVLDEMLDHELDTVVFSSTAALYSGEPPFSEEDDPAPKNFYGYTKQVVEEVMEWYGRLEGLRWASLRYFNAVGYDPRISAREQDPANLFPIVMEAAAGERSGVTIFGGDYDTPDGTPVRDYIHVSDLARAHVQALEYLQGHDSLLVNLGTGSGLSVREVVLRAQELFGSFPVEVGERRAGDPAAAWADASRAKDVLGWEPRHSDLTAVLESMGRVYGVSPN